MCMYVETNVLSIRGEQGMHLTNDCYARFIYILIDTVVLVIK